GMASAAGSASDTSFLGSATVWPLKRYGRFLPPKDGDDQGPSSSWKVFESNEESGPLVLTIVESGHFFISQERTVLEGFSLIDSHKWLKIVRRADCLLLRAQAKNECRMFRVQFGGSSKEQMQEHCCSCVHKLSAYVPVQGEPIPPCPGIPGPCPKSLSSSLGRKAHIQKSQLIAFQEQQTQAAPCFSSMQEGWGVAVSDQGHLPTFHWQWALRQRPELPPALWQPAWSARELGLFIRLCLMDQHFPAFVEDVERELHRLAEE
uniref:REC114 meiotic recombination protein n=1 Tax=Catharus ustulatus TaxID=91951 RepID=A0A8C3UJD3_CATUS